MDQTKLSQDANTSKGFFLLFLGIAPCTVIVPKIINIRTKQSFASIAFFITENNWTKEKQIEKFYL